MAEIPESAAELLEFLQGAADDTTAGRFEEALQKFLWFHDASRGEVGMGGVRLSFALGYWMDLARQYHPAEEAFKNLRDELQQRCRDLQGDFQSFHEVSAFNRQLDDDQQTIDLFLEIAAEHPDNAKSLYHVVERLLVAHQMFEECAPFIDWQQRIEISIQAYHHGKSLEESRAIRKISPPDFARPHFVNQAATIVGLLAVNGRNAEALQARDRVLEVLDDAEFRHTLEQALAGEFPDDEDIEIE